MHAGCACALLTWSALVSIADGRGARVRGGGGATPAARSVGNGDPSGTTADGGLTEHEREVLFGICIALGCLLAIGLVYATCKWGTARCNAEQVRIAQEPETDPDFAAIAATYYNTKGPFVGMLYLRQVVKCEVTGFKHSATECSASLVFEYEPVNPFETDCTVFGSYHKDFGLSKCKVVFEYEGVSGQFVVARMEGIEELTSGAQETKEAVADSPDWVKMASLHYDMAGPFAGVFRIVHAIACDPIPSAGDATGCTCEFTYEFQSLVPNTHTDALQGKCKVDYTWTDGAGQWYVQRMYELAAEAKAVELYH